MLYRFGLAKIYDGDSRCRCSRALDAGLDAIYFFNESKIQVEKHIKINHLLELKNIYKDEKTISIIVIVLVSYSYAQSVRK
jgi:hypothetical protein